MCQNQQSYSSQREMMKVRGDLARDGHSSIFIQPLFLEDMLQYDHNDIYLIGVMIQCENLSLFWICYQQGKELQIKRAQMKQESQDRRLLSVGSRQVSSF